ncbi:MAG: nucleotidyltransferase family protein [Salinivirgaceae bacterium]|jgi:dTDP-glucose pyrophosphorylase
MEKYQIPYNSTIKDAIKVIDEGGIGFCVVVDKENAVIGVITDGDFRRAVLNGVDLNNNVITIYNHKFHFLEERDINAATELLLKNRIKHVPIIKNGKLIDVLTEDTIFKEKHGIIERNKIKEHIVTVIMAGGQGTRLEPFTKILPKPLIPIGDKSMIEIIMDEYIKYGVNEFYLTLNHKANLIKAYFDDDSKDYNLSYIHEKKPLGTGGALKFVRGKVKNDFFVSNCDIIIKDDYSRIFDFHKENKNLITIIGSMQNFVVPYGVCEISSGGILDRIIEKPEFNYLVNTGMYVINPEVLDLIPDDTFYHITHLIEDVIKRDMRVGVYPVSEKSWLDVGQWSEYKKTVNLLT